MKICDLTQFYSPLSGGVKRYVHEKIAYIEKYSPEDEHEHTLKLNTASSRTWRMSRG